ncbi:hypothetical protein ACIQ9Q_25650 [Streptomyces sp. NPDC094438]|uniref:hypothetical protein n=1 Tax=Streptomyces sp. NPDC094438 TaxID=3366061 RepID=UPI00380E5968
MPRQKRDKKKMSASGGKKISAYNQFLKDELPRYKAKKPRVQHKDAFRAVAQQWSDGNEGPKS